MAEGYSNASPGLDSIMAALQKLYPDQPNPPQMASVVKYWLGGPDPVDYISMYSHPGDPATDTPPHWHYITFGLSDLHGDNRVHEMSGPGSQSGFGFELTFRLLRYPSEDAPPTWPAQLLQKLSKYVFYSGNRLHAGDNISWQAPIDGVPGCIENMLLAEDIKLPPLDTPLGIVQFVQVVGITAEELRITQEWNTTGVLELLKQHTETGGPFLITDMRREDSIFYIDPSARERFRKGIEKDGSNLTVVSCVCSWKEYDSPPTEGWDQLPHWQWPGQGHTVATDTTPVQIMSGSHVMMNQEAGSLLNLALRGRILHGRHFTFKDANGDTAITMVTEGVDGSYADAEHPFAAKGPWLHIFLKQAFVAQMIADIDKKSQLHAPIVYNWPDHQLKISILPD